MLEAVGIVLVIFVFGLSGWLIPFEWNLLRPRRLLGRLLPERINRLIPKVLGTILMLFSIVLFNSMIRIGSSIIPPTESAISSGGIQFAYMDDAGIVHEVNEIPVVEGISYGWTFLCTEDREYSWSHTFYYPRESNEVGPQVFKAEEIEYPRKIKGLDSKYAGVIGYTYVIGGNGDAEGTYVFEIEIEGNQYRLAPTFKRQ